MLLNIHRDSKKYGVVEECQLAPHLYPEEFAALVKKEANKQQNQPLIPGLEIEW